QAFEYLLSRLYSHELSEAKELAGAMHSELNQLIPSFVKRAQFSEYLAQTYSMAKTLAAQALKQSTVRSIEPVTLVDYDTEAEEKVIAAILYPHARHSLQQLRDIVAGMEREQRGKILAEYFNKRRHRRDKPGRAFENVYYTFDVLGNLGL